MEALARVVLDALLVLMLAVGVAVEAVAEGAWVGGGCSGAGVRAEVHLLLLGHAVGPGGGWHARVRG